MLQCAATVRSPLELQAKAKAESARVKMKPPWAVPWPLVMSRPDGHGQPRPAGPDLQDLHAERPAGAVVAPHRLGRGPRDRLGLRSVVAFIRLPRELGRPLLDEGADALGIVRRAPGPALQVALEVELGVQAVAGGGVERLLDQRQALGRLGGEMGGQGLGLLAQRRIVHRLPDQAPFLGLLRRQRLGQQRQAAGAGGADQPRQE